MSHVYWEHLQVTNDWQSLYLGSIFQSDGDELSDILHGKNENRIPELRVISSIIDNNFGYDNENYM